MSRRPDAVLFSATQRFRPVLRLLQEIGFDPSRILADFNVTEAQLLDPGTRMPRDVVVRLSAALAREVRDPEAIGVRAAAHFKLTDLGLLGYVVRNSEHVLGALQRFSRYSRLIADAAECRVFTRQRRVVFRVGLVGARPISPQGIDYALATVLVGMREVSPLPLTALAVRLARPTPRDPKPFFAVFGVRVEFEAQHSELVFDQRAVLRPVTTHDPQLLAILERHAENALAELPNLDSFIEQVRALIAAGLDGGTHGCEHVAANLGVSVRTLRRRLDASGLSHRAVLDQIRRERALALVAANELSVVEIAQRVGFSDPSAFAAAFRRWTGHAPRALRLAASPITAPRSARGRRPSSR
jgi:AraC-like DNA-binding protein